MSDFNHVVISGRLTRDPIARGTDPERPVVQISVASNRSYRPNGSSEWLEDVTFVDVTVFNGRAKQILRTLRKGARVTIDGRLELNRWQAEDGSNRQQLRIVASNVESAGFFTEKREDTAEQIAEPAKRPPAKTPSRGGKKKTPVPAGVADADIPF
jgi:single-strand DNA-binding protein